MKYILTTLAVLLIGTGCDPQLGGNSAGGPPPEADPRAKTLWSADLFAAQARAKENGKLVLIDFTGSDWCPPCMMLHDHVLTQKEFLDYAEQHLELVVIDFPKKTPLDEATERANQALAQTHGVNAFPTIIVMDGEGKVVHRYEGYGRETAKGFTDNLAAKLGR